MDNLTKQEEKRIKKQVAEQDKRCVPIAEEVLQIIAKHKPSLAEQKSGEDVDKIYAPIYKEIMELFLAKDIKYVDINYILKLTQLAFENTKNFINQRKEEILNDATNKLYGVDDFFEITLQKIDNVLKLKSEDKK